MGNIKSKRKKNRREQNQQKKETLNSKKVVIKTIIPSRYEKRPIDIVEYDKLFQSTYCNKTTISVDLLIDISIENRQYELLEYVLIQELMSTQRWTRQLFVASIKRHLGNCGLLSRLTPIKYLASYCVPQILSVDEFKACIKTGRTANYSREGEKEIIEMTNNAIDIGIQEMVQKLCEVKKTLISLCVFPDELIPIIISYLFPWSL
eukprot:UN03990